MSKIVISLICCCFLYCSTAYSQTSSESVVNFQTPNAASLGLYTQVPISQFTGTANIDIPLYEIVDGSFKVPISLSYHPSSVRVHSHPGWLGLGWSLLVGGSISRHVNAGLDEFKGKPSQGGVELGFYSSFAKLAGTDTEWMSTARMQQYASDYIWTLTSPRVEATPDEFSFSFLGYSGKFFRTHEGQWKVVSDQEIKVEFDPTMGVGFIPESGLPARILDRINDYPSDVSSVWTDRYFNKFTLVTPDGARFEFGGQDATEYTGPYLAQDIAHPVSVTWFLTKITTSTGTEIIFTYEPGNIVTSLTQRIAGSSTSRAVGSGSGCSSETSASYSELNYDGTIMFPVYLASISYPRGRIEFDRGPTEELRWPTDELIDWDLHPGSPGIRSLPYYFEPHGTAPHFYQGYGEQREWFQLNKIKINDYAFQTYPLTKVYNFAYTSDPQERLKLKSIQEESWEGIKSPPFVFTYNARKMPSYSELRSNDHWDFYNGLNPADFPVTTGLTLAQLNQQFYKARESDVTGIFTKAEVLEQIQYPTKGKVRFEYEPNIYSKVVDRENASFPVVESANFKVAGGLRIKKILHYSNDADVVPSLIKEYFYVKDFSLGVDLDGLKSSGILGGYPKYYWPNYTGKDIGGTLYTYSIFSSGAVLPYGYNTPGNHIGYSEVTEVSSKPDGTLNGYTKYKFSNFDADIWGVAHPDEIGFSLDPSRSVYSPYTLNDAQRGKLLAEEQYSNSNQPVRISKYQYGLTSNGYIRRLLQESFDICSGVQASAQGCYVTAFKTYINRYNLVRKEVTEYDVAKSFTVATTYEYNTQNLLSRTTQNTSDASILATTIKYPLDYTTNNNILVLDFEAIGISKLVKKGIINAPIETVTTRNGLVEKATLLGYKVFSNNVFPHKQWTMDVSSPLIVGQTIGQSVGLDTDKFNPAGLYLFNGNYYFKKDEHYTVQPIVFDQYDDKGNVREVYRTDGPVKCYIWSYRKGLPVAEIVGATFSEVSTAGVDLTDLANTSFIDATLRTKIATIRGNLPKAHVTGYTYSPFGITSKIDPNGRIAFYVYDELGRLIFIKDNDGKIVQAYNYHFSGEN